MTQKQKEDTGKIIKDLDQLTIDFNIRRNELNTQYSLMTPEEQESSLGQRIFSEIYSLDTSIEDCLVAMESMNSIYFETVN